MNGLGLPLILVFLLCGAGTLLAAIVSERRNPALLAWTGSLASLAALWASGRVLWTGDEFHKTLWTIPSLGTLTISLDRLSALFLFVAAVVVLASAIFSANYLMRYAGHYSLRAFSAEFLLLFGSIVWILIAGDVLGFLIAWEAMSILSYLLVNFEYQREGTASAGYLMLAMSEAGFVAVSVVFLVLAARSGSFEFASFKAGAAGMETTGRWMVFLLTFFGFGVKAGLVPVNSWLPRAHPAAPANVSAILSGVILNLGLYGIVRVNLYLVPVRMIGAGVLVLLVGTVSALVGILYATTESDLKALLAHSSIENIGIVTIGLGAGMTFSSCGHPVLAGMAFVAAFYHMINHSISKGLLFLGAGAVDDGVGTRDLDKLGGLLRWMPWTGGAFLVGALAIAAVPPLNGFVSEWLTLQALLRGAEFSSTGLRLLFAMCGAGLALTAALAVTCFVKAFAMGFLGIARSESAAKATEAGRPAIAAMVLLAGLCVPLGVLPTYIIPALNHALQPLINKGASDALVPAFFASNPARHGLPAAFVADFHNLGAQAGKGLLPGRGLVVLHRGGAANPVVFAMSTSYGFLALAIFLLVTWGTLALATRRRSAVRGELWAGGIPRLLPAMTYTATGFSNPVRVVFQAIFRPNIVEDTRKTVAVHFRTAIHRRRDETYLVDRLFFLPVGMAVVWIARRMAVMHHGRLSSYVAYLIGFLLLLLALFRLR
jgi:hydrogenase-4 component B